MLSLYQFQETAAGTVASHISDYIDNPAVTTVEKKRHVAPFFQALSALTGSGKTVILAEAVSQIADTIHPKPIIMWLSRGKVVVRQTFVNLSPGGKYHHLLDGMLVDALANYNPDNVEESDKPLVYFATVGTFNQKDKESGTLLIHKSDVDNMESSIWNAISTRVDSEGNRRPLIIVYDEAQNLSNQQTELLLELEPDGFLLASATMRLPARIGTEVQHIKAAGYSDEELITRVATSDVVAEGLIKDTVLLEGYNTPMEEAISQLLEDWKEACIGAESLELGFKPKAIYVCNTNVVAETPNLTDDPKQPFQHRQAPPILIWRYLVDQMGINPQTIAVYADLKTDSNYPLPDEFTLFKGGDKDYDDFTDGNYQHIIFNLTLQEGWDDPAVYFAYIDKSMESSVQITQVIGRVLRQPGAEHYPIERLNSAHFYVRVDKNEVFNEVIDTVKNELGEGGEGVRIMVSQIGKPTPKTYWPKNNYLIPETAIDPSTAHGNIKELIDGFPDYRNDKVNTKGAGSRRILRQKVGQSGSETEWEEYEYSSHASARWIFYREVQRQYKWALGVVDQASVKLDAVVGIGSPAYKHVLSLADSVVSAYIKGVRLLQRKSNPYKVGSILARPDEVIPFANAVHEGYAGLNAQLEMPFAEAIDSTGATWARNPARSGYGIPLISIGPTSTFYPDFLVWTPNRVVCVDTKGAHLVDETARRKLLKIRPAKDSLHLDVQFVSKGKYNDDLELKDTSGFSCWSLGEDGRPYTIHFNSMEDVANYLITDINS